MDRAVDPLGGADAGGGVDDDGWADGEAAAGLHDDVAAAGTTIL